VRPGELVFDIGAGERALTAHLVRAGARVVAVELNPRRVGVLRERFPGITVVHADATSIRLPGRPFRVVASPPYGISSSLLRTLLAPNSRLVGADLVLQRAVVRKYASASTRRFSLTMGPHPVAARVRATAACRLRGRSPPEGARRVPFANRRDG
jgi:23S rRNA (adenine-N6)-dimethyltransferase